MSVANYEKEKIIAQTGFCDFFTDYSLVDEFVTVVSYEPGESIICENESITHLVYIFDGKAKLCPIQEHEDSSLQFEAPWFTGEVNLFRDERTISGVTAFTACHCILVEITEVSKSILLNDAVFLRKICEHFAAKIVRETKEAVSSDIQKIAEFILSNSTAGEEFELNKDQMGFKLGMSRQYVQKVIKRLVEADVLDISASDYEKAKRSGYNEPSHYLVIDYEALKQIVRNSDKLKSLKQRVVNS